MGAQTMSDYAGRLAEERNEWAARWVQADNRLLRIRQHIARVRCGEWSEPTGIDEIEKTLREAADT